MAKPDNKMKPLFIFSIIILILAIAWTALTLYFEHRADQKNKEWQEKLKRMDNSKKN
ncbi:MAG: hypothetical protein GOVbin568_31 [Prokaryotic dsDNA virus sp.]|nr:MAG: hypothetical protein GOVbin568_31 [Prokaryotic dsDNA virus sp.]